MKHYHVLFGFPGCTPNTNYVYRTLAEAEAGAVEFVRGCKACQAQANDDKPRSHWDNLRKDEYPWVGNARDRYWTNGVEYVSITECHTPECLESEEL